MMICHNWKKKVLQHWTAGRQGENELLTGGQVSSESSILNFRDPQGGEESGRRDALAQYQTSTDLSVAHFQC